VYNEINTIRHFNSFIGYHYLENNQMRRWNMKCDMCDTEIRIWYRFGDLIVCQSCKEGLEIAIAKPKKEKKEKNEKV
jgi:hypothetical protein